MRLAKGILLTAISSGQVHVDSGVITAQEVAM